MLSKVIYAIYIDISRAKLKSLFITVNLIGQINSLISKKNPWKIAQNFTNRRIPKIFVTSLIATYPDTNTAIKAINEYFTSKLDINSTYPHLESHNMNNNNTHQFLLYPLTMHKIISSLKTTYSSKHADDIPSYYIKTVSHLIAQPLTYLIHLALNSKTVPLRWKNAIMDLFLKSLLPILARCVQLALYP